MHMHTHVYEDRQNPIFKFHIVQKGRKWHYLSAEAANARVPNSSNARQLIVAEEKGVPRAIASLPLELELEVGGAATTCELHSKSESEDSATSSKTSATSVFGDGVHLSQEMAAIEERVRSKKTTELRKKYRLGCKSVVSNVSVTSLAAGGIHSSQSSESRTKPLSACASLPHVW